MRLALLCLNQNLRDNGIAPQMKTEKNEAQKCTSAGTAMTSGVWMRRVEFLEQEENSKC